MQSYYIGVDVGSGSVRAGLFSATGRKLTMAGLPVKQFRPQSNFVEQSSSDIWHQTCSVVSQVVSDSGIPIGQIKGIGFDATCSLVVLNKEGKPLSVSPTGNDDQNVIMWMDHRAIREAADINATNDNCLKYVGGEISPEMELPKLLWLKRHLPEQYDQAGYFFDLADYLVWQACGNVSHSVCTKTCKWLYLAHEKNYSEPFFQRIGLSDLLDDGRIGKNIRSLGECAGYLTDTVAKELGLHSQVAVAVGAIDAHAGGIGIMGSRPEETIAVIAGTSTCHMAVRKTATFVSGVWGPYYEAMVPGYWLNEGGQSSTGSLIDHIIQSSSFYKQLEAEALKKGCTVYQLLNEEVLRLEEQNGFITKDFHVLGYHLGNRSPRANPTLRGMISGLSLQNGFSELAKTYLAALQSISYGTRHIIETMNNAGHSISTIHMCGGGSKNPLWVREHADATGCDVVLSKESDAVILGSAMLAGTASGDYNHLTDAMSAMSSTGMVVKPRQFMKSFHEKKYQIFLRMHDDQINYQNMMEI